MLTRLSYDAVKESPRRGRIAVSTKSEDRELTVAGRQALSSAGRDLLRNLALAGFAIRKHNQIVGTVEFKCAIPGQAEYNDLVKRWMYAWGDRRNCDIAGRHSLKGLIRIIETQRVIDGDVGILKCNNGKLQIIESDRIRNPPEDIRHGDYEWIHGVKVGSTGKAFQYAIHKRKEGGNFEFERNISAEHLILCGYFSRHDQIRGVSLLAPAINQFKDVYESIDYALAKAKLSQLLGFLTKRNANDDSDDSDELTKDIKDKFGVGTVHFDLSLDESAEMIESQTPSTQFQSFMENVIRIAFAALDLPLEFLMPNIANFYSNRGALHYFIEACRMKQEGLTEALNEITDWRIRMAIADGELPPPPNGMDIDTMLWYCDWEGARLPMWQLLETAKEALVAIQTGLISNQKITRQYGIDLEEVLSETAQTMATAKDLGVPLAFENAIGTNNTFNIGA
ncbi:MAG: phage portal protein [Planctomycetaceae bacterium]|nr:phage portal protein [Planctomycetaceae bacterium]